MEILIQLWFVAAFATTVVVYWKYIPEIIKNKKEHSITGLIIGTIIGFIILIFPVNCVIWPLTMIHELFKGH